MGEMAKRIERKLLAAFQPERLSIVDDSQRHHGHAGWKEGGETHFHVAMRAAAFTGKSRLERQRLVYAALGEELKDGVHALALSLDAPEGS